MGPPSPTVPVYPTATSDNNEEVGPRTFAQMMVLGVSYYVAAHIGLVFAIPPGNATAVWPASGIALAGLLLYGQRIWPGIWLAAFLVNTSTNVSSLTGMLFATGNTLEAVLAAWACRRFAEDRQPVSSIGGAFLLLLTGIVSCSVAATIGTFSLAYGEYIGFERFLETWSTWWLGDLTGIMVVTPFVLTLRQPIALPDRSMRSVEQITSLIILALISHAIFGGWLPENVAEGLLYLPLIVLFWMILRLDTRLACLGSLMMAAIAVIGTSSNVGPFFTESSEQSLFDLQIFLNVYAFTGLALAGIVNSERSSEQHSRQLVERLHITRSRLKIARTIQSQLLPESPLNGHGYECAGGCTPAEETGGDYFDFIEEDNGSIVLVVGDVCGHGVGAAMLISETRAYLRAVLSSQPDLSDATQSVNAFLQHDLRSGRTAIEFVTLFICRFRPDAGTLEYVGAGHQGFIVRSDGTVETLDSATVPLGVSSEIGPGVCTVVPLHPADIVMLITDGVTEARAVTGDYFGLNRVTNTIVDSSGDTIDSILKTLMTRVERFTDGTPQADDMTAAFLRVTTPPRQPR